MIDKEAINKVTTRSASKSTKQHQKESLRVLVENSSVSSVRNTGRIIKYGAASFKRNVWLSIAATLVMTITLIILLITVGASMVLSATADTMRQKIDITVYFQPGTEIETLNLMAQTMRDDNNVRSVDVSDSAAELQAYIDKEASDSDSDILETLSDPDIHEAILRTMPALMRIKVYDPDNLDSVRYIVENDQTFQTHLDDTRPPTYDVNKTEIAAISSWATIAKNGGLILGAVFLVISVLVIFNTIRMAIFSRREEIHMMKLVGADTNFIRGPFLVEAQISGIISGLLAATAFFFGFKYLAPSLENYGINITLVSNLIMTNQLVLVYLATVGVGIIVGTISAHLAMQKYLK